MFTLVVSCNVAPYLGDFVYRNCGGSLYSYRRLLCMLLPLLWKMRRKTHDGHGSEAEDKMLSNRVDLTFGIPDIHEVIIYKYLIRFRC